MFVERPSVCVLASAMDVHSTLFININQLDALNFYNKFISSLYMSRQS